MSPFGLESAQVGTSLHPASSPSPLLRSTSLGEGWKQCLFKTSVGSMPRHSDQGFGAGVDLADLDGRDSGGVESVAKSISCWRGNQQASGGLGIEQKGTHVVGKGVAVFN